MPLQNKHERLLLKTHNAMLKKKTMSSLTDKRLTQTLTHTHTHTHTCRHIVYIHNHINKRTHTHTHRHTHTRSQAHTLTHTRRMRVVPRQVDRLAAPSSAVGDMWSQLVSPNPSVIELACSL